MVFFPTATKDVILLNFYADWCRYSAALKPIFDKAAEQVHSETVENLMFVALSSC